MHSNDYEAPSTSVKSNFGSESVGKSGYGSEESSDNGKNIYRDLNKQFKDVLPENETCSSLSEDDPVRSNDEGDKNLAKTTRRKTGKPHKNLR